MSDVTDRERELAQALAEYHDRIANEETLDPEEFCRRYPHIEAELRASLATLQQIDSLSSASTEPAAQPDPWGRPETLSGHNILGEIGSGGMGTVWLAAGDGLEDGTLAEDAVVVSNLGPAVVGEAPTTAVTGFMLPRGLREFNWRAGKERWLLREQATVEVTPVAPAFIPPDPYGWLAELGDEDFVAVALLG